MLLTLTTTRAHRTKHQPLIRALLVHPALSFNNDYSYGHLLPIGEDICLQQCLTIPSKGALLHEACLWEGGSYVHVGFQLSVSLSQEGSPKNQSVLLIGNIIVADARLLGGMQRFCS